MYLKFIPQIKFFKEKHLSRNVLQTGSLALHGAFAVLKLVSKIWRPMEAPLITAVLGTRSVASLQTGEDHAVSLCFQHFSEVESKHNFSGHVQMSLKPV